MTWQDISTAPKDGTEVDLWCVNIAQGSTASVRFAGMSFNTSLRLGNSRFGAWEDWHGYVLEPKWKPTHWMSLPDPPKVQEAG